MLGAILGVSELAPGGFVKKHGFVEAEKSSGRPNPAEAQMIASG